IKTHSVPVSAIASITFTEKAANQMKAEIARKVQAFSTLYSDDKITWEKVADMIHTAPISTIHAFCNSILRRYPFEAAIDPLFTIIDDTTLSCLIRDAIDNFLLTRMDIASENMDILIRTFGISGLKRMLHTLYSIRTQLITFLDKHTIEKPEILERRYTQLLKEKLKMYLILIREFLPATPVEDSLFPAFSDLYEDLSRVFMMCEEDKLDIDCVKQLIEKIKGCARKGSKNKWIEKGIHLEEVREGIKECSAFLEILASFYQNERGLTAPVVSLLLQEYDLLERHIMKMKKSRSFIDHDDTLIETWRLLRNNISVCQEVSRLYKHILVDEFQDTDGLQMDILRMIVGNSASALFTVGDPKQSIYRFRGADVTIFNEFIEWHNVYFKTLRKNYRSAPSIVKFVNHVFERIMGKDIPEFLFEARYYEMKPHRKDDTETPGVEIVVFDGDNADARRYSEADFITERALNLKEKYRYNFGDMALILKKGTRTRPYEESFLIHNIPFVNLTSGDPFKSPEAYDIANLLGWLCEPNDPVLFSAVLLSPFFHVEPEVLFRIYQIAGKVENVPHLVIYGKELINHPWLDNNDLTEMRSIFLHLLSLRDRVMIREILELAFDETDYTLTLLADPVKGELSLSIIDYILESADAFEVNGGDIREFARLLSHGDLVSDKTPFVETKDDAVNIITIHKAKGMEYKVVFLADVTSTTQRDSHSFIFDRDLGIGFSIRDACGKPTRTIASNLAQDIEHKKEIAESKRLFYVGCTRAENHLIISGGNPPKTPDLTYEKSNWMGWIHTALALSHEGAMSPEYPENLFTYRHISVLDTPHRISPADYWKNVIHVSKQPPSIKHPEIEHLITPVKETILSGKPDHLSPTQIQDYFRCPALYLYKHVYDIQGLHSGKHDSGFGEQYGSFAHRVLERWDFSSLDDQMNLVDTLGGNKVSQVWKEKFKNELLTFTGSDLYQDIRNAREIFKEEPFAFIEEDVLIRGSIDLLYRKGDNLCIVDYKTEHIQANEVEAVSEEFRLQLGIYGLAVYRAEYQLPEKLVIYFLTPGVSYEIPCTHHLFEEISAEVSNVIMAVSAGKFSPKQSDGCLSCPYIALCTS
ncbi:MAG TPA: UvrD-helicase domain-containing protein, partial [Anaerolineae bacterium]|nr:UvrD-helicase domain-containing protein [Anaerolineae bacterium]